MELNQIKQLLEKYYDGNTSLEEEKLLKDFFRYRPVPAELETDKELFLHLASESKTQPIHSALEQKLEAWIDKQEPKGKKISMVTWRFRIAGVAAMLAIVVTCYVTMFRPKNDAVAMKDTYKNPELAYAEAKQTMLYISQQLNKGTQPLSNVGKLNMGMNKLAPVSSINNGMEQLQLVSKYMNTSKKDNNKTK